jgi:hypothetical protein
VVAASQEAARRGRPTFRLQHAGHRSCGRRGLRYYSPVSRYAAPFEFTGHLLRVTVVMHDDQTLDGEGVGNAQMVRQQERYLQ